MNADGKFWTLVWRIVAMGAIGLTLAIGWSIRWTSMPYIQAGYTQVTLPGHSGTVWVRPDCEKVNR